ncbi:MAG: hypothetical protein IJ695_03350 [Butyrivibrio sp.]|nr:hypothetical protein [Butyrivibrio sp.]
MRDYLDEKLAKKLKKEEDRKVKPPVNDDEEEETYMYDVRKPMAFINEGEHGVFDITKQTGLNTAGNVFDRTATFKTH